MCHITQESYEANKEISQNNAETLFNLSISLAETKTIKAEIRAGCTPRHVPAKVLQVADIPRTKSGKIVELAVRDVVHGRSVKNKDALANPEALDLFAGRAELSD